MRHATTRREFLLKTGISAAAANLVLNLPSLGWATSTATAAKKRIVFLFSPNGVIPKHFWPDEVGEEFQLNEDSSAAR